MNPEYRFFLLRIIEMIEENKEFSERIGINNTSHFVTCENHKKASEDKCS